MKERLDCRKCGCCCISHLDQEEYCDITPKDEKRLSKSFLQRNVRYPGAFSRLVQALDRRRGVYGAIKTKWMRMKSGPFRGHELNVCHCLRGSVMKQVSCTIYNKRPEVCRKSFQPGDKACLIVRQALLDHVEDR